MRKKEENKNKINDLQKNHKQKKPAEQPKQARSQAHGKAKKLRRAIAIHFPTLKERSHAGMISNKTAFKNTKDPIKKSQNRKSKGCQRDRVLVAAM